MGSTARGHHHHLDPGAGDRRVLGAVGINLALTVVQVAGGLLAGSLALVADALHNLSDAVSLLIAWLARRIARRPADAPMTFGYGRAELVAALINYTTLIVIGLILLLEAGQRLAAPAPVDGWLMVLVAGVALVVDLATAALTWRMASQSMNIRAAFLHNMADALGSLAVIVAGTAVLVFDWRLVDPLATLLIAGVILHQSLAEIGGVIRILMLGAPPGIAVEDVVASLRGVDGVAELHDLRLWQPTEDRVALEAHVAIEPGAWGRADAIKARLKARAAESFGIRHTTFELECAAHACCGRATIGYPAHGEGSVAETG